MIGRQSNLRTGGIYHIGLPEVKGRQIGKTLLPSSNVMKDDETRCFGWSEGTNQSLSRQVTMLPTLRQNILKGALLVPSL